MIQFPFPDIRNPQPGLGAPRCSQLLCLAQTSAAHCSPAVLQVLCRGPTSPKERAASVKALKNAPQIPQYPVHGTSHH